MRSDSGWAKNMSSLQYRLSENHLMCYSHWTTICYIATCTCVRLKLSHTRDCIPSVAQSVVPCYPPPSALSPLLATPYIVCKFWQFWISIHYIRQRTVPSEPQSPLLVVFVILGSQSSTPTSSYFRQPSLLIIVTVIRSLHTHLRYNLHSYTSVQALVCVVFPLQIRQQMVTAFLSGS